MQQVWPAQQADRGLVVHVLFDVDGGERRRGAQVPFLSLCHGNELSQEPVELCWVHRFMNVIQLFGIVFEIVDLDQSRRAVHDELLVAVDEADEVPVVHVAAHAFHP